MDDKRKRTLTEKGRENQLTFISTEFCKVRKRLFRNINNEGQGSMESMRQDLGLLEQYYQKLIDLGHDKDELEGFKIDIHEIEVKVNQMIKVLDEERRSVVSNRSKVSQPKGKGSSIASRASIASQKKLELTARLARLKAEKEYQSNINKAYTEMEKMEIEHKQKSTKARIALEELKHNKEMAAIEAEIKVREELDDEIRTRTPQSLHSEPENTGLIRYLEDTREYSSSSSTQYSPLPKRITENIKTEMQSFPTEIEISTESAKMSHNLWRSDTYSVRPRITSDQAASLGQEMFDKDDLIIREQPKDRLGLLTEEDNAKNGRLGSEELVWKDLQPCTDTETCRLLPSEPVNLGKDYKQVDDKQMHKFSKPKSEPNTIPKYEMPVSVEMTRPSYNIFPTSVNMPRSSHMFIPDSVYLPQTCTNPTYLNTAPIYTTASFDFNPIHPNYGHHDTSNTVPRHRPRPTYNTVPRHVPRSTYNAVPISQEQYNINTAQHNQDNSILLQFAQLQHQNFERIVDLFTANQKKASLPVKEPEVFSGDLLTYPMWKASFKALIEQKTSDPHEKLYYLNKYTSGEAKAAIHTLISIGTQDAYDKAQKILTDRYGNKFLVANAYRSKLEKWPKIALNDGSGLRKFYDFLEQCKSAMTSISYLTYLNDPKENTLLLQKLPTQIAERWNTITTKRINEHEGEFPSFEEFTNFIGIEAKKACNPTSSYTAIHGKYKEPLAREKSSHKPVQRTTFLTKHDENNNEFKKFEKTKNKKVETSQTNTPTCVYCEKSHHVESCSQFLSMDVEKRHKFCVKNRVCTACLKYGHAYDRCYSPKQCKQCSRWHPTILHNEEWRKIADAKYSQHNVTNKIIKRYTSGNINSMIVPVKITNKVNNKSVNVYALLDDQSDACFIEENLLDNMNATGEESTINVSTMIGNSKIKCKRVFNLNVEGMQTGKVVELPCVYSRQIIPAKRNQIPTKKSALRWPHLQPIADKLLEYDKTMPIGLLIGANCINAIKPVEIIPGKYNEPYAQNTLLGWGIIGNVATGDENDEVVVNKVVCEEIRIGHQIKENKFVVPEVTKEIFNEDMKNLQQLFNVDFASGVHDEETGLSIEDRRFLEIMEHDMKFEDGHFEFPLPLKNERLTPPNNYGMAKRRLMNLKVKMSRNPQFQKDYSEFMGEIIKQHHAEIVPESEIYTSEKIWYIPHHGVYHPKKPHKIRVVFDCSCKFKDFCLNENMMQGPDLTNNLVGILCRFRMNKVAFTCDIQQMFHQVKVKPDHRNLLRFLWFKDNDINGPIVQYRMTVHVFGARSSPSVVNFALKSAADKFKTDETQVAAEFIQNDFYVDDGIKSVNTVDEAITLLKNSQELCKQGGFHLHKVIANHPEVIKSLSPKEVVQSVKSLDLTKDELLVERTLGIEWHTNTDEFCFKTKNVKKPNTRRGVLSIVSSLFDPLGIISPFILSGKKILQILCKQDLGWDDPIPEDLEKKWMSWLSQIEDLDTIRVKRCYAPLDVEIKNYQLHHFSDASEKGYGQCSYLVQIDQHGSKYVTLVMSKARVSPIKPFTIPRLELTAALVSVKVSNFLKRELKIPISKEIFWVDSKVVLGYIFNESKRFKIFVANRVQEIRKYTLPSQWKYVNSNRNPADLCSRGVSVKELSESSLWWSGPDFLKESYNEEVEYYEVESDDPEIKICNEIVTLPEFPSILERLEYFSDWTHAKKSVALCHKYLAKLKNRNTDITITSRDITKAEIFIIKAVQLNRFNDEYQCLNKKVPIKKTSPLYKLDPYLDDNDVIRVGGRLRRGSFDVNLKYPVILPKDSHVTDLIMKHCHSKIHHQGRNITLNAIRSHGFWIVKGTTLVAKLLSNCVTCRKVRHPTCVQKMADLPHDRIEISSPFSYSAVDYFGPFFIKEGRREQKRYGVLFTCMSTRAVHLETAISLNTDSFINAYRRFVSRRGPCIQLRSDHGSNFIGTTTELNNALKEMDTKKIGNVLMKDNCEYITFKMNPPNASHMGGVWERQIKSVRNILNVLLSDHSRILNDECFRTFMCEAENIINGRPLTYDAINDPFLEPLTPNHFLLTTKSKVLLPPPGNFVENDKFSKKSWRRVQYLLEQFWRRWQREYLQSIQPRQKWLTLRENIETDDICLIKDYTLPRNHWSLGRVVEVMVDDLGLTRKVKLILPSQLNGRGERMGPIKTLERPIHNLVLIVKAEKR